MRAIYFCFLNKKLDDLKIPISEIHLQVLVLFLNSSVEVLGDERINCGVVTDWVRLE
jgi:hypothetical protein